MSLSSKQISQLKAILTLSVLSICVLGCQTVPLEQRPGTDEPLQVFLIGDSTVATFPPERHPLKGWGQLLHEFFVSDHVEIVNMARSGRSSKSYYDEGAWELVHAQLDKGDYVFIQFGHNDEKKADPTRYTAPYIDYQRQLLRYVQETRVRGAVPVLVTPLCRNIWVSPAHLKTTHGEYPDAMRALAKESHVPLLDLHAMTRKRFEELGPQKTHKLFMNLEKGVYPAYPEGKTDNTHLNIQGAREVCRLLVAGLEDLDLGLRSYLLKNQLPCVHEPL